MLPRHCQSNVIKPHLNIPDEAVLAESIKLEKTKTKKQLSIFSSSFYCDCCLFCYKYLVLWRIFLDLKQLHNVILIREAVSYNFSSLNYIQHKVLLIEH